MAVWLGAVLTSKPRQDVHVQCAGLVETRRRNVDDIEVFMLKRWNGHPERCMFVEARLDCITHNFSSSSLKQGEGK
jgi:hypothetical protein